ncbi:GDSL esterase/lipase [Melia azedarach]|nr:GDSL esterase/lipase [Melia azedarach]
MKQRERLDKVERVLSFYKTSKGSPFQAASTHVRGEVDVLGAVLMMGDVDQLHFDALDRAGIRTGIYSRFTFETTLCQDDTLAAEFVASQEGGRNLGEISGSMLSLTKLFYAANVGDWFSAIVVPFGAQYRDFDVAKNISHRGKGLTNISSFDPPLLNQHNGGAIGLMVRKPNVVASLAQSVSGLGTQLGYDGIRHCFSTFGQVACQLSRVKLSLMGLQQGPKSFNHFVSLGSLTVPVSFLKQNKDPKRTVEASAPSLGINNRQILSTGYIALKLETELDESTKIGSWVEMQNSDSKRLRWAVTISDNCEDELGWGASVGGIFDGPKGLDQYQIESFIDLTLDKRFSLKPGVAYVVDRDAKVLALMLRCNWFF